jgi:hypothetical protein
MRVTKVIAVLTLVSFAFMATVTVAEVPDRRVVPQDRIMAVENDGPITVVTNDGGGGAADTGSIAYAYKGDYDSGYGLFLNYFPNQGLLYPGTMTADEVFLGNGFQVDKDFITGFEVLMYRSSIDPTDGKTLANFTVELWDGDPFGAIETPNSGIIASATFIGLPGPGTYLLHADVPKVQVDDPMIWVLVSGVDTCRTGWRISGKLPAMGDILQGASDLAEAQTDYDAGFLGAPG